MKNRKFCSKTDEAIQTQLSQSRRDFLTKASLMLAASGLNFDSSKEILSKEWAKLFPTAHADELAAKRVLEICLRSGVPNIIFSTGAEFSSLSSPAFSNFSYAGNQVLASSVMQNKNYFNTDSQALLEFAPYIANTQGLEVDVGHVANFSTRHGGRSLNLVPAIVELTNRNPTRSLIGGAQWKNGDLIVNNNLGNLTDLTNVTNSTFKQLFKKPSLKVSAAEVSMITAASKALSRRQALMLESKLINATGHASNQARVADLMNNDYTTLLNTNEFSSALKPTGLEDAGESLGLAVKAMSLNLINSATVAIQLGDLHGFQADKQLATITRSMSGILASLIKYLQQTPDQSGISSKLWDTTTIIITSEFTRGVSRFGMDNSDSSTNGVMFIGKQIQGGYYGSFNLSGTGNAMDYGFDPMTGVSNSSMKALPTMLAHKTTRYLAGLEDGPTATNSILKCMVRT